MKKQVEDILLETLSRKGVEQWFNGPNRLLGFQRPVDTIKTNPKSVIEAANAFVDGSYV